MEGNSRNRPDFRCYHESDDTLQDRHRMTNHHAALIYTMVLASAADSEMTDSELKVIGDLVRYLPGFLDYDENLLPETASA